MIVLIVDHVAHPHIRSNGRQWTVCDMSMDMSTTVMAVHVSAHLGEDGQLLTCPSLKNATEGYILEENKTLPRE